MSSDDYCRQKVARSGSSFYYSFLFLPAEQRQAITALYAFCREVDDIVDECSEPQLAAIKLQWWREELQKSFRGSASHPVTQALQSLPEKYGLLPEHLLEVIDGMQMDLQQTTYRNFDELALYCYRVAGVVGLMSATIFGYNHPETQDYARDLGTALQLTNIVRDLREDANRGRIYIPLDELAAHGVEPAGILQCQDSPQLRSLLASQAERADHYYDQAMGHLCEEDRFRQRCGLIMAEIYHATLREIERDGFRVLERRIGLTPLRKLWIAWHTARAEKRRHRKHVRKPDPQ